MGSGLRGGIDDGEYIGLDFVEICKIFATQGAYYSLEHNNLTEFSRKPAATRYRVD